MGSLGEDEDIGKSRRSRGRTQENEVGRYAKGAATRDNPNVLREVGNKDSNDDQAARVKLVSLRVPMAVGSTVH